MKWKSVDKVRKKFYRVTKKAKYILGNFLTIKISINFNIVLLGKTINYFFFRVIIAVDRKEILIHTNNIWDEAISWWVLSKILGKISQIKKLVQCKQELKYAFEQEEDLQCILVMKARMSREFSLLMREVRMAMYVQQVYACIFSIYLCIITPKHLCHLGMSGMWNSLHAPSNFSLTILERLGVMYNII